MENSLGQALVNATRAQGMGVTLALIGCLFILIANLIENRAQERSLRSVIGSVIGIVIPFLIAYGTFFYGFLYAINPGNQATVDKDMYIKFIRLYLFADAILLPIAVGFSGGVKQSLFAPLFFAIPAMAVVFVPESTVFYLNLSLIFWVTAVTLAGYLIVYWLQYWLSSLSSTSGVEPRWYYGICECAILVGSVALTVSMSLKVPSLL